MKAKIFNIAHGSLHDGKGVRTVMYMKGCSLKCLWCHNPEGISPNAEILFHSTRCIKCGRCVKTCPAHHTISCNEVAYIRENCAHCQKCVEICPNEALLACGRDWTPADALADIIKDKHYYEASGGGVTFSGGECLLFPDFLQEVLKLCKDAGINTAIETACNVPWKNIEAVLPLVDTFIVDIKHPDSKVHKKLTGCGNELILDNIRNLSVRHPSILIRIPLIPSFNDDEDTLKAAAGLVNSFGSGIKEVELLKYNNMAGNKYKALGYTTEPLILSPQDDATMQQKYNFMRSCLQDRFIIL